MERSRPTDFQHIDIRPKPVPISSLSPVWSSDSVASTFADFEMINFAVQPGQTSVPDISQQHSLPSDSEQWRVPRYPSHEFSQLPSLPGTPCSTVHGKGTGSCCAQFHEIQDEEMKKAKRQEQNRANQRAFRARQDRQMKKLKEDYAKLEEEYRRLHVSYNQQAERAFFLESKLRENMRLAACNNCTYRFDEM